MQKMDLQSVLQRKIVRHTKKDLAYIFDILQLDYKAVLEHCYFDSMFVADKEFDFAQGYLCGTVKNVNGKCVLTDLALREQHLF